MVGDMQPAPHPHDPPTRKAAALLRTRYGLMMGSDVLHVRLDLLDRRQGLTVVGTARELHGGQGSCSCCPRRPRLTVDGDEVGVTPA